MLGLGPPAVGLVGFFWYAILEAVALSVAHAWAEAAHPSNPKGHVVGARAIDARMVSRYMFAWAVCTVALALPVLIVLDFPEGFASPHANVGQTAIALAALTAAAAIGIARRQRPPAPLQSLGFRERATDLFPIHLAVVIILGAVGILILCVVFLGNIH
jgi:hypothetical protein